MPQASTSLKYRHRPLADPKHQRDVLRGSGLPLFGEVLEHHGLPHLKADSVRILQMNLGRLCNMTCRHCHVDAGPDRREVMTRPVIDACLKLLPNSPIDTLDLTGGAPEMNPHFRDLVCEARRLGIHVIDRCNLTILQAAGYEDLPEFLAAQQVEVVASLPCYLESNTDRQRGQGAYRESVAALKRLNAVGYGRSTADTDPVLTLVFNPAGPSLPPNQLKLEQDYRDVLRREHGIEFSRLFTITNMPISRFLEDLLTSGEYETYMRKLLDAFNPAAADGLMCRHTLSVSWDGRLFDCDFNQMLDLGVGSELPQRIEDFRFPQFAGRPIVTGPHCFGCTAGAGSGCQGATVPVISPSGDK